MVKAARVRRERDDLSYGANDALEYDSKKAGSGVIALSWLAAIGWVGAALVFADLSVGLNKLTTLSPQMQAGIAFLAVVPALLILFAGAAARETARSRAQANMLSAAADKLLNPSPAAEAAARKLGVSVRGEIAALERAIDQAMAKAQEVEDIITRQTQQLDGQVLAGMERERSALLQIAEDLNSQAGAIGNSISRHARVIEEAANVARSEISAADETLSARLTSFGEATSRISDKTGSLARAAEISAESAHRLDQVIGGALDALAQATSLTDAARKSAEQASHAANSTAGAVREITVRAVEDSKRAAEVIRGEAAAVERDAASALERLREAGEAAREAAQNVRLASQPALEAARQAKTAPPQQRAPEPRRAPEPSYEPEPRPAAPEFQTRAPVTPRVTISPRSPNDPASAQPWTWREVLASVDDQPAMPIRTPQGEPRRAAAGSAAPAYAPARHPLAVVNVIDAAGLTLPEIFDVAALDRVAQRARNGTQARRRAVCDAAPEAVRRISDMLSRDAASRSAANEFLSAEGPRIAELLGRGRASMSADATRAFLLVDAASA